MDRPTLYRLSAELSYRRSPVTLKASVPYDGSILPGPDSPIARSNLCSRASGTKWYDLAQFFDSLQFAISDRVKSALLAEGITGWGSVALDIPEAPTAYHLFFPTCTVGPILNLEALNNYETEIIDFDLSTWDGSDVFTLRDTLYILVAERVHRVLEEIKATNADFRRC